MTSLHSFGKRDRATKRPATRASLVSCRLQFEMLEDRSLLAGFAEIDKLTASDAEAGDSFGEGVAVSGDTVVVGAIFDDDACPTNPNCDSGSAYVFTRSDTTWRQQAKLTASDADFRDRFGRKVAVSGDTVVVGARKDNDAGSNSGSAYVFQKPASDWTNALEDAKLIASDAAADDMFGTSVAISGDTIVVGAEHDDDGGSNSGSAYVFVRSGTTWSQAAKLTASDAAAKDHFGWSVAISGDTIVVAAIEDDDACLSNSDCDSGSAYVFQKPEAGWTNALEDAKLAASDAAAGDQFGWDVAVSGDTVVVSAWEDDHAGFGSGSAYVFQKPASGWTNAMEDAKLTASDAAAGDQFGSRVSISGNTIVVGAVADDDAGSVSGSAYVFQKPPSGWTNALEDAKLTASDAAAGDAFGWSVAVSGDTVVVSGLHDDDACPSNPDCDSGSAYVFSLFQNRLAGDANHDGKVDARDLNALALNWQRTDAVWSQGDFDGNGVVDAADLNILALNWQMGVDIDPLEAQAAAANNRIPRAPLHRQHALAVLPVFGDVSIDISATRGVDVDPAGVESARDIQDDVTGGSYLHPSIKALVWSRGLNSRRVGSLFHSHRTDGLDVRETAANKTAEELYKWQDSPLERLESSLDISEVAVKS